MAMMVMDDHHDGDDDDDDALPMRLALAEKVPTPCYACIKSNPFFKDFAGVSKQNQIWRVTKNPSPQTKMACHSAWRALNCDKSPMKVPFLGNPQLRPESCLPRGGTRRRL